jgi:hypothetical protein
MIGVYIPLLLSFFTSSGYQPLPFENPSDLLNETQWECAEPQWANEPGMDGDEFVAVLENDCKVIPPYKESSLKSLNQFLVDGTKRATIVHEGPNEEVFENLPSVYLDITVQEKGTEEVTIRQDVHIATDLKKKLIFDMKSKSCTGTGMAEYLRFVATRIELRAEKNLVVKISNEVRVEKPWYAPESIFVSEAKKTALEQFYPLRTKLMNGISGHL